MKLLLKLKKYLVESYYEMHKVSWPTKKQTVNYSLLVISMSFAVAVFFGILDYVLNIGLETII